MAREHNFEKVSAILASQSLNERRTSSYWIRTAMRYWWVNQNMTYAQEISGGYLWSPKRKANGDRNVFYEFMREVAPGDIVFSFRDTRISALESRTRIATRVPSPLSLAASAATGPNRMESGCDISRTRKPSAAQ